MTKVPLSRFRIVHNGVDVNRFIPSKGLRIKSELGLTKHQPVVGMFASFKPQKNHLYFLRAARLIIDKIPDARFLFLGDELYKGMSNSNEYKKKIMQRIDEYNLNRFCIFAGNKSDIERYYPACTVTVLPSLFEGTPNVALESMACGVPVVATNVSDNSLIVKDGRSGYIVPLDDEIELSKKICHILTDESLRERMAVQCRHWVESEFSCRRLAQKTATVYNEVTHGLA
jgi:glycosyltransferase involved in cell wall biosynthesis